jgi:hypothetical protein
MRCLSTSPRRWAALGAVVAASAALPATASADSIVHLKDGDVHLTTSDGSRSYRVTDSGDWSSVSQSENGVIVGAQGRQLFRLSRTGEVLNEITTAIRSANWNGPYDIDVSPDGTKVAYGFLYQRVTVDPDCPFDPSRCSSTSVFSGVAYSNTDGAAAGVPMHTGWSYPAWVDDTTLVHSDPDGVLNKDLILRDFGSGNHEGTQWYAHPQVPRLRDAAVRGNVMALIGGNHGELLAIMRHDGEPGTPGAVEGCLAYGQPAGRFRSPTLAPGARAAAWTEDDGIWRADFEDQSAGCSGTPQNGRLLIPGGSSPDWGPADVPPARSASPEGTPPQTKGDDTKATGPETSRTPERRGSGQTGGGERAVTLARSVVRTPLTVALRKGLPVTVRNATGTVRLTATLPRRTARRAGLGRRAVTVATGRGTARSGRATVRLRFTRTAARRLRRLRTVTLTVASRDGAVRRSVTLRR